MQIARGDVFLVSLDPVVGSEQGKTRPAVVVQNNVGNEFSPTIIVVPLTSKMKNIYPTDAFVGSSKALCSQIRTVDKSRIVKKLSSLNAFELRLVDDALRVSLSL